MVIAATFYSPEHPFSLLSLKIEPTTAMPVTEHMRNYMDFSSCQKSVIRCEILHPMFEAELGLGSVLFVLLTVVWM